MGIRGFFNAFVQGRQELSLKDIINGKVVCVDIITHIIAYCMKCNENLCDNDGKKTVHIVGLLNLIHQYKMNGVKDIIFAFDSEHSNIMKKNEHKKRQLSRDKNREKIKIMAECIRNSQNEAKEEKAKDEEIETEKDIEIEKPKETNEKTNETVEDVKNDEEQPNIDELQQKIAVLERRNERVTREMVKDLKKIITALGMSYIVAKKGYEAEHVAAKLTHYEKNKADIVMSSDSDTLVFGAKNMVRKSYTSKKLNAYELYDLDYILKKYNITLNEFIHKCVILGCDFCEKSKGIGIKTVHTKGKNVKLSEEQQKAYDYYLSDYEIEDNDIITGEYDKEGLLKWLVSRGFDYFKTSTKLAMF